MTETTRTIGLVTFHGPVEAVAGFGLAGLYPTREAAEAAIAAAGFVAAPESWGPAWVGADDLRGRCAEAAELFPEGYTDPSQKPVFGVRISASGLDADTVGRIHAAAGK